MILIRWAALAWMSKLYLSHRLHRTSGRENTIDLLCKHSSFSSKKIFSIPIAAILPLQSEVLFVLHLLFVLKIESSNQFQSSMSVIIIIIIPTIITSFISLPSPKKVLDLLSTSTFLMCVLCQKRNFFLGQHALGKTLLFLATEHWRACVAEHGLTMSLSIPGCYTSLKCWVFLMRSIHHLIGKIPIGR